MKQRPYCSPFSTKCCFLCEAQMLYPTCNTIIQLVPVFVNISTHLKLNIFILTPTIGHLGIQGHPVTKMCSCDFFIGRSSSMKVLDADNHIAGVYNFCYPSAVL